MVRLTASDIYTYHRPSKCELRVYLRHHGEQEAPPSPYEEILRELGEKHEATHLQTFTKYVDLSLAALEEGARRTKEEVARKTAVIYQPVLKATLIIKGVEWEVIGQPDFLIYDSDCYVIRDSKISRRINERDHPEIFQQLELYGWLYEQSFDHAPSGLQVHSGANEIIDIPYGDGKIALELLQKIAAIKEIGAEFYSPVGWSKCTGCAFHQHCWPRAEKNNDVALVFGVDQGLAEALRERGTQTYEALLAEFDEHQLAEFQRPWGKGMQRVGKKAKAIMHMAEAKQLGEEIILKPPEVPEFPNYVMFDLEGLPPQLDELEKIYLWGVQVFGNSPGEYRAAIADFGVDGDRRGWEQFLEHAKVVFDEYGDLPFVHWHHYEKGRLNMYIERYGDPDGIVGRVQKNLLDLLPITQNSIALPLPSYSLKSVEKYVGFKRSQDEYGGSWAMAKYIEAIETEDENLRAEVMDQILVYNQEDLAATWAVLQWLKTKAS